MLQIRGRFFIISTKSEGFQSCFRDLFVIYSRFVRNLFAICLFAICFVICLWFVRNLFAIYSQFVCNLFVICLFTIFFVIFSGFIRELFVIYSQIACKLFVRLYLRTSRTKREFREVCSPFSKITNVRSSFILACSWTPYGYVSK